MNKNIEFAHSQIDGFMEFANGLSGGYCKQWKATGILVVVAQSPNELTGERLEKYIDNCLNMEGFNDNSCKLIAEWIDDTFKEIRNDA